ncbi:NBR1-Ig-like domain-containing protein [Actinomadura parmotrematis]|uniref:Nbr1 FW domain-containing protein n=1 Tax=Actinomadura parmotrematis TaxID=2864039 RepID=A0ABS7FU82_9ACTN|nr:NBR1-Ig-like domain-containing protein [Actinomadura parmotrematis]MBW8483147.1 hypothetical protein [Actinomadura parmotrematis]
MSGRSGAISHTTLHEATKGNRLPSWGTTAEFVKACGADPGEYRERWESASRTVRGALAAVPAAVEPPGAVAAPVPDVAPPPAPPPASAGRRIRPGLVIWPAVVVAAGAVALIVVLQRDSGAGADAPGAVPCPVRPTQPASAAARHAGDAAAFVADVTLPDCAHVAGGRTVTKTWRIRNTGTVRWKGYSLVRLDAPQRDGQCRTAERVPIADTRPGRTVDVRAAVTTPDGPAFCYVRFKMLDAAGRVAFPGNRPVNFQVVVDRP